MLTLIIFILVLAVLVLSHEFGHFIVARKCGIKVDEFGFGFPPRLVGIRRITYSTGKKRWHLVWGSRAIEHEIHDTGSLPGTLYSINWLPLGGFVRIKGEDGENVNDADSFSSHPIWQRMLVVAAGVVFNVALAAILLSTGYLLGAPSSGGSIDSAYIKNVKVHVLQVLPESPAARAGFEAGDIIDKVDGQIATRLTQVQDLFGAKPGQMVTVSVIRGNAVLEKNVVPLFNSSTNRAQIGVGIAEVGVVQFPWYLAIYHGVIDTGLYLAQIILAFYYLIVGLFAGASVAGVSGPIGVAVMTGEAARLGLGYLIQFMAMLSLNLAVLNILPIPALDGGRLFFLILNKVLRRPVPQNFEKIVHALGFILLLILVLAVSIKDLSGLWSGLVSFFKS